MYEELNDDLDEVSGIFNAESEILGRLGNRPMGYGEGTLREYLRSYFRYYERIFVFFRD